MKKVFITMIAFLALSSVAMADGHVDSVRYLTTKFGKNWFISGSATCNWWQSSMRTPESLGYVDSYTAVRWDKPTFGFNVNGGKWLNHCTGVRLAYSNTRINSFILGRHSGLEYIQFIYGDNPEPLEGTGDNAVYATSMRFHNLRGDYMISPIDFFQGYYNPKRVWTPVLYVGGGISLVSEHLFGLQDVIGHFNAVTEDLPEVGYNFELAVDLGLSNNFRVSKHLDINLDLNWTVQKWTIDSWSYEFQEPSGARPKRLDNMYTASLGLTYFFSREYDLPKDCCAELDSIKKLLPLYAADTVFVHDTVVNFVNLQTEDIISYPFSIFFNRDSYQLMSKRDLVNLREIAKVAKENGYKLRLRGSCDSATATPAYNQTLSENRCRKIMMELMELGIPEDQIILVPVGGVKELNPTEYDRRVLIELVKEAK